MSTLLISQKNTRKKAFRHRTQWIPRILLVDKSANPPFCTTTSAVSRAEHVCVTLVSLGFIEWNCLLHLRFSCQPQSSSWFSLPMQGDVIRRSRISPATPGVSLCCFSAAPKMIVCPHWWRALGGLVIDADWQPPCQLLKTQSCTNAVMLSCIDRWG